MKVKSESEVAQSCPTFETPWTAAYQAPPSMGFSRQEYWSGVPLPFKVMLKILQARLQQYMNFQMFKLALEKAEEPEIKWPTSTGSSKKAREFQKNIYFCYIDYVKSLDCADHNNLWKILKEMGKPDHLTCLLRNLDEG